MFLDRTEFKHSPRGKETGSINWKKKSMLLTHNVCDRIVSIWGPRGPPGHWVALEKHVLGEPYWPRPDCIPSFCELITPSSRGEIRMVQQAEKTPKPTSARCGMERGGGEGVLWYVNFSMCLLCVYSSTQSSLGPIAAKVKYRVFARLPGNPHSTENPRKQSPPCLEFPKCPAITDTSSNDRNKQTWEKQRSGPFSRLQRHKGEGLSLPNSEKFSLGKAST